MKTTTDKKSAFWIQVMEKLNANSDLYQPIPEILMDLCDHFGFGCAFVYEADHTGVFFLHDCYAKYENDHLQPEMDLAAGLGAKLVAELAARRVVAFSGKGEKGPLEQKLGELFNANLLIMVPVTDQHGALIAFVGFADRRGSSSLDEEEQSLAYAVLSALANHTKLQLYQNRAEGAQKALESVLDNMGVDIYVNDFDTHEILYVNRSMAEPYGGVKNLMGKKCWQALYDDKPGQCDYCPQRKLIDEEGNPTKIYSWDYQRPFDGSWFRVLSAAFRWADGRLAHVVSSVDITENKRNEEIIRQMAEMDMLTGLPNRRKLLQACDEAMTPKGGERREGYLLFFDLDGFKHINDTMGHRAGDELLVLVGKILEGHSSTKGKIYRHGGDEFVILCPDEAMEQVQEIVAFLHANFEKKHQLEDGEVALSASVGIAHYPFDAASTTELLHNADEAMYAAKRAGVGATWCYNKGDVVPLEEYANLHPGR